jgi:two-component system cell cycle sensor histidine kinase/response regulator CckA
MRCSLDWHRLCAMGAKVSDAGRALDRSGFDALFHGNPDAIYVFGLDGEFIRCNERFTELTGYNRSELLASTFAQIVPPEEFAHVRREFFAAAAGENRRFRARGFTRTGELFVVDITNIPLRDHNGHVVAVIGIARDIGKVEDAIFQSDCNASIMRIASRLAGFGGWSIEVATGELYTSDELDRIFGTVTERSGHYAAKLAMRPEPHRTAMGAAVEQCIRTGESFDFTSVFQDSRGERHVRSVGEAVRAEDGEVVRVQGALYDISDIVAAESARARSERTLQSTLDQIATGVCFLDRQWRFTFINKTAQTYIQMSASEVLGKSIWQVLPDGEQSEFGIAYRQAMDDGVVTTTRSYFEPMGGWFEATAYPTIGGIAVHIRNVTQDQELRLQLEESSRQLQAQAALLDAARDAIFVRQLDDRISYWNQGAEAMYGWAASEAAGQSVREILYEDTRAYDQANVELLRVGHWTGELVQVTREGESIIAASRWQLERDELGRPSFVLCVSTDITDYRRAQDAIFRTQRMESLGSLAGGIAHDLNNVLTPILMSSQLLMAGGDEDRRLKLLQAIESAAKHGADMIRQVLAFARGEEGQRCLINVEAVIDQLEAISNDTLPKSIKVTTDTPGDLWPIVGDPTQILQVLVNLVTNARDSMSDGGGIKIRARNSPATSSGLAVGRTVVIDVEDTGSGMDLETLARVFEPFFTTKGPRGGTGLGLPTSMTIVRAHGGQMEAYSESGRGSLFRLILPTATGTLSQTSNPTHLSGGLRQGRGEKVLVVDDESAIRELVRQTLESNGYEAFEAANGAEAIAVIESGEVAIDLVFTDMIMPVLDGAATAAYLLEARPDIAVVAATGLNGRGVAPEADHRAVETLAKPFTTDELLDAVRRALDTWQGRT